jgi:hypothetical protein
LLFTIAEKLPFSIQPKMEILAWRAVRLLPEVIGPHAGFF